MKTIIFTITFTLAVIGFYILGRGYIWLSKASDVATQQVDPALLLKRYEWFKEASAQADKRRANIEVFKARLTSMEKSYEGTARKDWDRTDKEQFNLWQQEIAGTVASYNEIAAEYNAAMAKFNYRFTNVGDLPRGAAQPLPREVKPYAVQ